jgi:hypothetical protein
MTLQHKLSLITKKTSSFLTTRTTGTSNKNIYWQQHAPTRNRAPSSVRWYNTVRLLLFVLLCSIIFKNTERYYLFTMTEYSQQPQEPNHPWTATLALDTMSNKKTVDIRSKSTDTNNTNLHLNSSQESKTATQLYHISELKPSPSPHDNHPHLAS